MKTRLKIIKLCILSALISTCFLGIAFSNYDETDVSSGNCSDGHSQEWITISTNYTGNSVTISEGQIFDLEITATGQMTGDVWLGYAFWHTSSDGIQLPDTSPFIVEDYLVNEWNDGVDYYAQFAWQTVINPMTRTFRINTTCLDGVETLTIQVAGDGSGSQNRYSNVIDLTITVLPAPEYDPPHVTITAPTNDSYVKGSSVSITATVDDGSGAGVASVWAEITNATYNETVSMSGTEPNYSGTWDSTVVADGTYTLTVKANDAQVTPNVNDTESITIKVDNNAPSIAIESIVPNPSNGITTITASNSSSDIDGNGIRATITPPTGGNIYLDLIYQGSNIWNNTFTVTQNGDYDVSINATDYAGNTATIGPTLVTGDLIDPSVTITYPLEGQLVGGAISITGTATGTGSNVASLTINDTIWGDEFQKPQIDTVTGNPSGAFSFENKSVITPKEYWVEINITDDAGNVNSTIRYFIFTDADITAPNILITTSVELSNGFTNITVTTNEDLNAGGPPSLNITLPSSSVIYRPMFLIGTRTWRTNYTVISDGTHMINVNATDEDLNVGYGTKSFEGDVTVPTITLAVLPNPSNGLTVINAYNTTETVSSILANISTPSGGYIYHMLIYQGSNKWNATFIVTESGIYTINVNGTDLAGNFGYNSQGITGKVGGPGITIVSITPNPSNGLTTITTSNTTSDIDGNGIRVNVSTPSAGIIYVNLIYQGSNLWTGTFTVTEDGIYTIWINATNNLGDTAYIGPSIINGDFNAPVIVISSPNLGDSKTNPPNFDVSITDTFLNTTWYSIFDGTQWSENITFSGATGTIDQTLWESLSNGELIIRFYANDSLGNFAYAEISFIKEEVEEDEPKVAILIGGEQLLTILIISAVIPSSVGVGVTIQVKKKRSYKKRYFKKPDNHYENAYFKYYGKKPRKKEF